MFLADCRNVNTNSVGDATTMQAASQPYQHNLLQERNARGRGGKLLGWGEGHDGDFHSMLVKCKPEAVRRRSSAPYYSTGSCTRENERGRDGI